MDSDSDSDFGPEPMSPTLEEWEESHQRTMLDLSLLIQKLKEAIQIYECTKAKTEDDINLLKREIHQLTAVTGDVHDELAQKRDALIKAEQTLVEIEADYNKGMDTLLPLFNKVRE